MTRIESRSSDAVRLLAMSLASWLLPVLILLASSLVGACGGGGDDAAPPEPAASTQPVNCSAHPEQCK